MSEFFLCSSSTQLMPWLFIAFLGKLPIQILLTDMFPLAIQFLEGWVIFAEYARPRPPPGEAVNNTGRPY